MAEKRGYDAGKKIVGRKRHIAVDTDGRLLAVNLTTADISDSAGAQPILDAIRKRWPWMKRSSPMERMIVAPYLIRRLSSTSRSRSCAEPIPTQGSRSFPAGGSLNAVSVG